MILGTSDISSTVGVASVGVPPFTGGPFMMILGTTDISSRVLASLAVVLSFVTGSFVAMLGSGFDAFYPISMIASTTEHVALNTNLGSN